MYLIPKNVLQFLIAKNKSVGDYFNSKEWIRLSSSHNYADEMSGNENGSYHNKSIDSVCTRDLAVVTKDTSICHTAITLGEHNTDLAMVMENE